MGLRNLTSVVYTIQCKEMYAYHACIHISEEDYKNHDRDKIQSYNRCVKFIKMGCIITNTENCCDTCKFKLYNHIAKRNHKNSFEYIVPQVNKPKDFKEDFIKQNNYIRYKNHSFNPKFRGEDKYNNKTKHKKDKVLITEKQEKAFERFNGLLSKKQTCKMMFNIKMKDTTKSKKNKIDLSEDYYIIYFFLCKCLRPC